MTVGHQASGQLEKGKLQFFLTEHLTRYKFPCRNLLTALWKSWGGTFTWRRRWSQQPGFEPNPPPNVWAYAEVHTPEAERFAPRARRAGPLKCDFCLSVGFHTTGL